MIDISGHTQDEQLKILERLWDNLSSMPETVPLTVAQREELDHRPDALERAGPIGIPVEEVTRLLDRPARGAGGPVPALAYWTMRFEIKRFLDE